MDVPQSVSSEVDADGGWLGTLFRIAQRGKRAAWVVMIVALAVRFYLDHFQEGNSSKKTRKQAAFGPILDLTFRLAPGLTVGLTFGLERQVPHRPLQVRAH